jgi:hypothetical protein
MTTSCAVGAVDADDLVKSLLAPYGGGVRSATSPARPAAPRPLRLGEIHVTEAADKGGDQAVILLAETRSTVAVSPRIDRSSIRPGSGDALERTDLDLAPAGLGSLGRQPKRHV